MLATFILSITLASKCRKANVANQSMAQTYSLSSNKVPCSSSSLSGVENKSKLLQEEDLGNSPYPVSETSLLEEELNYSEDYDSNKKEVDFRKRLPTSEMPSTNTKLSVNRISKGWEKGSR